MFTLKERLLEMCDDSYNDSYSLPEKEEVDLWGYQHFLELKKIYRGISSSLMFDVVLKWNRVLEDGLEDWDENEYAMYGLHNYDTENPNLKPCPFCGNNPVWHLQGNIHTI